jgi:RimJ/RimL family protein N-acetyltransferase
MTVNLRAREVLTGAHISLGPVCPQDLPALHRWINDRDLVLLSAPYRPVHVTDQEAWWRSVSSDHSVELFAIRTLDGNRLVGTCQLLGIDTRHRSAELQIRIGEDAERGRGLGTEAVELLLRHAFADRDLERVSLHVFASNARAIAAYEKNGFVREGLLRGAAYVDGRREDVVVMAVLRDEWERRPA